MPYDRAIQTRLAAELDALPDTSLLPGVMADYAALRDQVRACQRHRRLS